MINWKSTTTALTIAVLAPFLLSSCNNGKKINSDDVEFASNIDSVSYGFGYLNGEQLNNQGMDDLDPVKFAEGLVRALDDKDSQIDKDTLMDVLRTYQIKASKKKDDRMRKEGEQNRKTAEEFLSENREKEGVNATESGLQYEVIEEGTGASPSAEDTVKVHYEGTLLDGTVFDSSYEREQPATFPLNRVISGWTEGVQLMKEGATYKFYVPGNLAYGKKPPPGSDIGLDELLIFKVELLEVQ